MIGFERFENLTNIDACRHAITIKKSAIPYNNSMALHTGEDKTTIIRNRKHIAKELQWHENMCFIVANQTHSDHIRIVKAKEHRGWETTENAVENCDALITDRRGIVLTMLTADCVPILLIDKKQNIIAAVHAGWKGTKEGILSKTVKKMCETFNCEAEDIIAGIGPSIGRCCYEVDSNVSDCFDTSESIYVSKNGKYMLDLPMVNKKQLLKAGLLESNIEMSTICTSCENEKFFSYRKEKGCSGRFMSMIALV